MTEITALLNKYNNPFELFSIWFDEASKKEINDPNAMTLSTVSNNAKPSSRMVLLKSFDSHGFVFYTNSNSKKGISIKNNPYVALNFHWKSILKQIRIEGKVFNISDDEADKYFNSRHEESRIGAWASNQSDHLENRKILEDRVIFFKNKFLNKQIPRPPNWNGYRVEPNLIEFWQDMKFRLHDRLEFKKKEDKWSSKKLFP